MGSLGALLRMSVECCVHVTRLGRLNKVGQLAPCFTPHAARAPTVTEMRLVAKWLFIDCLSALPRSHSRPVPACASVSARAWSLCVVRARAARVYPRRFCTCAGRWGHSMPTLPRST